MVEAGLKPTQLEALPPAYSEGQKFLEGKWSREGIVKTTVKGIH